MKNDPIFIKGTILGGILDITEMPEDVIIEIKDYDCSEYDEGEELKDENGSYRIIFFGNTNEKI